MTSLRFFASGKFVFNIENNVKLSEREREMYITHAHAVYVPKIHDVEHWVFPHKMTHRGRSFHGACSRQSNEVIVHNFVLLSEKYKIK